MAILGAESSAAELQARLSAFRAGHDRSLSEQWLVHFQRADGAWQVASEVLRSGPQAYGDAEFLHVFCAQTLATVAKSAVARFPVDARQSFHTSVRDLLRLHQPPGQSSVWKQLALALTCVELWEGTWSPVEVLSSSGLSPDVQRERLALPTELLFCERALPLSDLNLWHTAAHAFVDHSGTVFAHLFGTGFQAVPTLRTLSSWLRATRRSFEWLGGQDEAVPLRCLTEHAKALLVAVSQAPEEASDVAQQLARWRRCDSQLSPLLEALLNHVFSAVFTRPRHQVLLPLLADLAADRWPRAVLGEIQLSWKMVSEHAIGALREGIATAIGGGGTDEGEAAMAVWQNFATTLRSGTSEWADEADCGGPHSEWFAPKEVVDRCEAVPRLFAVLSFQMLELLRVPERFSVDAFRVMLDIREVAQSALASWALLVGDGPAWQEALWSPLKNLEEGLIKNGNDVSVADMCAAEAVLWFSGTLAACDQNHSISASVVSSVLEFKVIDAVGHMRPGLWSAACTLVAAAQPEHLPRVIEWMLDRSPYAAGTLDLLEFTELPYARSLESACRNLPQGDVTHLAAAERIASLALTQVPANALHEHSSESRGLLLRAMRHTMRGDVGMLCKGLAEQVLPVLCRAFDAEVAAGASPNQQWNGAQTFFATCTAVLPERCLHPGDGTQELVIEETHPIALLFGQHMRYFEGALLQCQPSSNDQPLAAAAQTLSKAALVMPVLLSVALDMLVRSADRHDLPELQLLALRDVVLRVTCAPLGVERVAALLATAVVGAVKATLKSQDVARSPATLKALLSLVNSAIGLSKGPCEGKLRPLILAHHTTVQCVLHCAIEVLPETSAAAPHLIRVVRELVSGSEIQQPDFRLSIASSLPSLSSSLTRAAASVEHLASVEGSVDFGDLVYRLADAFPDELLQALQSALGQLVHIPEWSRALFLKHIERRKTWEKRWQWMEQLKQLISDWQAETRQSMQTHQVQGNVGR